MEATLDNAIETVDAGALRELLDGEHRLVREHMRAVLARPEFGKESEPLPTEEYRELVMEWTRPWPRPAAPPSSSRTSSAASAGSAQRSPSFETLAHSDLSLLVKCGVQFGLFGGAVHHLGTRKHHEAYLQQIATLRAPRRFAMSETGHGSNVQNVRTTATYDPEARASSWSRPRADEDRKDYIGNAARPRPARRRLLPARRRRREAASTRARPDPGRGRRVCRRREDRGLRPQARPQRRRQRPHLASTASASRATTCSTATPRVSAEGEYTSPIENQDRRFFTMLGTLIQGRISVGGASISATKSALTIAVRHAPAAPPVRPARLRRGAAAARLPRPPAPPPPRARATYALHFAQARRGRRARPDLRADDGTPNRAEERPPRARDAAPPGSRRSRPGTRPRRSRPAASAAAAPAT